MQRMVSWLILSLVLSCLPASVRAEGWQMPNLNPFSGGEKAEKLPASAPKSSLKSWMPSMKPKPKNGPSLWDKTKAAPGTMWNGTKNAVNSVNPFKSASKPAKHSNHYMSGNAGQNPEKSKSWFDWSEEKPVEQPKTVSDWIALPRVE
jgi:hypothetical protein